MNEDLAHLVRRHGERHADGFGVAQTPLPALRTIHATAPSGLQYAVSRPLACLVTGGEKQVTTGGQALAFGRAQSLIVTADVPTTSRITRASRAEPYGSLVLDLDAALIADLSVEMRAVPIGDARPVRVEPTDGEVADAALRLLRLLDRPAAVPVLQSQLLREMHYWLLAGRHGPAIRHLGLRDSHARRVARAVAVLRADYAKAVRIEDLAAVAGMSPSSFHQHFRAVTSLSPLQFQKHLRLVEARRLILGEGVPAGAAAFAVGYESASQFTREYGRLFGQPPVRERRALANASAAE